MFLMFPWRRPWLSSFQNVKHLLPLASVCKQSNLFVYIAVFEVCFISCSFFTFDLCRSSYNPQNIYKQFLLYSKPLKCLRRIFSVHLSCLSMCALYLSTRETYEMSFKMYDSNWAVFSFLAHNQFGSVGSLILKLTG